MTGARGPHLTRSCASLADSGRCPLSARLTGAIREHALDRSGGEPGPSTAGTARVRGGAADGTGPAGGSLVMVPGKK
jgi:hypothetical protein